MTETRIRYEKDGICVLAKELSPYNGIDGLKFEAVKKFSDKIGTARIRITKFSDNSVRNVMESPLYHRKNDELWTIEENLRWGNKTIGSTTHRALEDLFSYFNERIVSQINYEKDGVSITVKESPYTKDIDGTRIDVFYNGNDEIGTSRIRITQFSEEGITNQMGSPPYHRDDERWSPEGKGWGDIREGTETYKALESMFVYTKTSNDPLIFFSWAENLGK